MAEFSLSNNSIQIKVHQKGAELSSLFDLINNIEYMWQANPEWWPKSSPVLFPVVGSCINNEIKIEGKTYPMFRHGFARDKNFHLVSHTQNTLEFLLGWDEEIMKFYPFKFQFYLSYELQNNCLIISYKVVNSDTKPLWFCLGAHPAFSLTFIENSKMEDYYLEFEKNETAERRFLNSEGYFTGETAKIIDGNLIRMSPNLFIKDALVFQNLNSEKVTLRNEKSDRALELNFTGFPELGIWAKPGAPFVCIEPWIGSADSVGFKGELKEKNNSIELAEKQSFTVSFSISAL